MPVSKNRRFAKIANDVATDGTLTARAISSDVTLGGATVYASRSNLPTSGNTAGDQAYVTANNRLYIWNGSGWYNIALLNLAPSIQSVLDSDGNTTPFALSADGIATTITITAQDSDGDPLVYTAIADSDFNGLATISQDSSVFTITPLSEDSATALSGTITFTAADGINVASSGVQTFTLSFASYTLATDYNNLTLATQGSGPGGNGPGYVSISADGTTGSIIAHDANTATAYKMSFGTAYDASTVSFTTQTFANVAHAGGIRGGRFSRDGLHLLVTPTDNLVWHYTLTTPYDVTTITSSQSASITGFARARVEWQADGGGILANLDGTIRHVPLSTPYDITTAGSSTSQFFHVEYRDIFISDDGTYMLVYENNGGSIRLINMTTAYDISTGTSSLVSGSRWYYINSYASTYITTNGLHVLTAEETKTRIYNI